MKRLYTYLSPKENLLNHEIIVLIDTFRATTTINTLFHLGAKEVLMTDDIERSFELKESGYVLCGERNSQKIKGFDFSNSPSQLLKQEDKIKSKKVLINTTNGSKVFRSVNKNSNVIALSLTNLKTVINRIEIYSDIGVVCSGLNGNYSLEDYYTAYRLIKNIYSKYPDTNDATEMSYKIDLSKDIIKKAKHYKNLKELKLIEDINLCLNESIYDTFTFSEKNSGIFKMI
ncbi:2-phosphosulfolactate phosphatase [Geotoga petraea]|uniref:Probable 2-phosphosulfolactate phosphatase n=1 Tax=Geotoga petraea TaxID=28234 RepID=A0A4Z0W4A0_9BACT|nr:2-phosphosulfolactate phosphatase [Geotoga petraea]TGG88275.1 2-phosphosulfolactate phosphatase [Geotoga petraea]